MTVRPTVVIAGAARSATTALADALNQHPDIALPPIKEPHFLAHAGQLMNYTGPGDNIINRETITHSDQYLELFAPFGNVQHRIDASVSTLAFPDRAMTAIRAHAAPNAKVIAILRAPEARALSAYRFLLSRGLETAESFAEGLELEEERRVRGFHHMWWYRGLSAYRPQVERFAHEFGADFRVVIAEEFRADAKGTLAELCEWLDVDPAVGLGPVDEVNRGGKPRSVQVARMLQAVRSKPTLRTGLRAVTTRRARERVVQSNLRPRSLDPDLTLTRLRELHAGDVAAVEAHLGRPVEAWQPADLER